MDAIRTLLLARTHVVVMDADHAANAATRPSRDSDLEKFEDELAKLGFVMSLDLAITIRRLPNQAIQELRNWIVDTLAQTTGAHRPHVPLFRAFPQGVPANTTGLYLRRVLTWLWTRADQPCPWCGEIKAVGALDPCGHLVCRTCWDGGNYAGCPICHRRVTPGNPFVQPAAPPPGTHNEYVVGHEGQLRLIHLAFDLAETARARFTQLLTRATPLSPDDRVEVEAVIDTLGPKAAAWLPAKIPVKESMAIAVARLWMVSPDRTAILRATATHLKTATDVLRIAVVLMGGDPGLVAVVGVKDKPRQLGSLPRGLRRVVLQALDGIAPEGLVEDVQRYPHVWKRVGERLHPFEHAKRLPTAALAFAVVRRTDVSAVSFGATLRAQANQIARLRIEDDRVRVSSWAGVIEDGLRAGDARGTAEQLASRPGELLRRADHLVRVTQAKQPEALGKILETIQQATSRGAPAMLLTLAAHVARRGQAWPRRVFFPKSNVLAAWSMADDREPLRADAISSIVTSVRSELVKRAEGRSRFARAVIDRGLADLLVPLSERSASKSKIAWPRGSEIPIPPGESLRLFLHWEDAQGTRVDLDLSVALFDASWRHVGTCDFTHLVVGDHAATHSGDLTSAPPPLGASEFVDLDLARIQKLGARHAVMVVFSYNSIPFDKLPHGFAGLMVSPAAGMHFDPRTVAQRFDLSGRSVITVPLTIDLEVRRVRWLDVHIASHADFHHVGGYRAALAHIGKDFADLASTAARPTLWDVACIHAAARANLVYVRERDGTFAQYRRRDGETTVDRLARLLAAVDDDGKLAAIPQANAPTWFALLDDGLAIPAGSEGYILDARRTGPSVTRLAAADLVAQLAPKS